ncbi:hypothetical protein D9M71_606790 [compost metagenome]
MTQCSMKSGEVSELMVPTTMSNWLSFSIRVSIRGSVPLAKAETIVIFFPLSSPR